jgi:hypothetical protein
MRSAFVLFAVLAMLGCTSDEPRATLGQQRQAVAWTTGAPMGGVGSPTNAAALSDGRVLVVESESTATIYNPTTNAWSGTVSSSGHPGFAGYAEYTTGKVFAAGGVHAVCGRTEVFDVATATWTEKARIPLAPCGPTTATTVTGGVLVVAGASWLYNTAGDSFTTLTGPNDPRISHTATKLADGKVLITGGNPPNVSESLSTAEIFDPSTKTWTRVGSMAIARSFHFAVPLASGKVLIVGGAVPSAASSIVELYDPASGTFSTTGSLITARSAMRGGRLASGRVLIAGGGSGGGTPLSTAEIYDPAIGTWSSAGAMVGARGRHGGVAVGSAAYFFGGYSMLSPTSMAAPFAPDIFHERSNGTSCTESLECVSGKCVDGVCCDRACSGQCEACDVTGSRGTCTNVTDAPHGARTACGGGFACRAGACLAGCAVDVDCDRSKYCTAPTCSAKKTNGATCGDPRECSSGFCADGRCCGTACGVGHSCAVAGKEGTCLAKRGTACTSAAECETSSCWDAVCCERDCAPFARCAGGTCAATCASDAECIGSAFCDPSKICKPKVTNGTKCARPAECVSGFCIDDACCGEERSCAPYTCGATGCRTSCSAEAPCAPGFGCDQGRCLPRGGTCSADLRTSSGTDGRTRDCAPFSCNTTTGDCNKTCATTADCAGGYACSTGACVAAAAAEEDSGCGMPRKTRTSAWQIFLIALVVGCCRRRR